MTDRRERERKYKKRKRRQQVRRQRFFLIFMAFVLVAGGFIIKRISDRRNILAIDQSSTDFPGKPEIDVQLLSINEYSRPGIALDTINNIVIHYTANPGSSASANRNYFENLKDTHSTKASSHFIVGLNGEIVQCVPTSEISYASNNRNKDTISIEVCHQDDTGVFSEATYQSVVHLTAWLCCRSGLDAEDVIRHYDITGKICPKYYVENEDAWIQFKNDVSDMIMTLFEL